MNKGFISLHRKILDWEWYHDHNTTRLFIHLLMKAAHQNTKWQGQQILRGQLITGRKVLAVETGISERSIRTCLENLKTTNELTIKTTNRFSLITLVNYEIYQGIRPAKRPAKSPTNDQQPTTNNNVYNVNKYNKENFSDKNEINTEGLKKLKEARDRIFNKKH